MLKQTEKYVPEDQPCHHEIPLESVGVGEKVKENFSSEVKLIIVFLSDLKYRTNVQFH